MHKYKFVIDPVSRIEGHLGIEVIIEDQIVKEANASGTLFRGIELILEGRDPRDASRITQRVCGVCPAVHAKASALCLDDAFGIKDKIPDNGRIIRNLIQGANFLQSHILHFYHLAALDYVDAKNAVGSISPFMPRYEGDYRLADNINQELVNHYLQALNIRRITHEMLTIFGGKMPHNIGIIAGGATEKPTEDKITNFLSRLNQIRKFIDNVYLADVATVAKAYPDYFQIASGCGNLLAYGGFELEQAGTTLFKQGITSKELKLEKFDPECITEDVTHSWYTDTTSGKKPSRGETKPEAEKPTGYSFLKSPRYNQKVYEVGPLARLIINYLRNDSGTKNLLDSVLANLKIELKDLFSALGRHLSRALEAKVIAESMAGWLMQLKPDQATCIDYQIPETGQGAGLTEAPRGSVGHWISIEDKKIKRYQIVTPTAWNGSPKDNKNQPGPIEQALMGVKIKDKENPFEVVRIIRTFDPCLACSVHLLNVRGKKIGEYRVV